ncbi:hypothetical protein GQF61_04215 [Sphingobacterium sp. DK4209]|uniref:Uncharacterized protein n=1 Tax=Sphingobacterium zhuxiongii TaxID=2662364 RepID=A0A5Q0QDY7_9SPHI|nr:MULTISPECIES: hypothetical protein [unclassified Sphingobacterium]MVZ65044.1 hypothetical protein [Sphingobacterium sp. DK4209]QGA25380.1 hypothetical protein GFH32_03165 [Sphingobacterium sp. dk4302]
MSYNTKYILSYCNRNMVPLRVELQLWDYVGEQFIVVNDNQYLQDLEGKYVVSNIDGEYDYQRDKNSIEAGANPFTLSYQNDLGKKGGCIRATSAEMGFFEDLQFNIDDLSTSDETEIRCVFYYNNEIEWIGFVYPDFFNVAIEENPLINLTASDRIGALKHVDYEITQDIEDKVSYLDIIRLCLKETGLELNINVICGIYSDEIPSETSDADFEGYEKVNPLEHAFVSEWRLYKDIEKKELHDCYTILKSILAQFNCLLTQYKGEWWIVNKYELELGYGILFEYDTNGTLLGISRETMPEVYFSSVNVGAEKISHPAGAKNTILLDNGQDMIYPLNYSLDSDNELLSSVEYWTAKAGTTSETTLDIPASYNGNGSISSTYPNDIREVKIKESNITVLSNDTTNFAPVPDKVIGNSFILESTKFKVVTLDKKKSSFTVNVKGTGKPNTAIMIGLFMEIEEGNIPGVKHYFSLQNRIDIENNYTGDNRFVLVSDINSSGQITVYPFGFEDKFNSLNIAVEQEWNLDINIAAGSQQSYDIETAKFFVRIYPNSAFKKNTYNPDLTEIHNVLKNFTITFKNDNQNPIGTVFQTKLTEGKFTTPTEQQTAFYGDYQTFGQNGYFYAYREDSLSIHYNASGERLKNWYTNSDSSRQPLLLHSLRQFTFQYGKAHDILSNIGFDMERINPFAHYAVRCRSEKKILVNPEDDYLQEKNSKYITATIGKYLNSKRFVFVEGKIDYLRSHFEGVLAQIRTNEVQRQEYIYSYFEQGDIS